LLIGGDNNLVVAYAKLFNCPFGSFPLQYLGGSNFDWQTTCH
jgi:hypothetical protein